MPDDSLTPDFIVSLSPFVAGEFTCTIGGSDFNLADLLVWMIQHAQRQPTQREFLSFVRALGIVTAEAGT